MQTALEELTSRPVLGRVSLPNHSFGPDCFAVGMKGYGMAPRFYDGDTLIVDPNDKIPKPDDRSAPPNHYVLKLDGEIIVNWVYSVQTDEGLKYHATKTNCLEVKVVRPPEVEIIGRIVACIPKG